MAVASWAELRRAAGPPRPRVFEAKRRLFGAERPRLRFWHDAAGWCPHCMVSWLVLEEMRIPYVAETTPLRAYLKPGERKRQRMVPVIELLDEAGISIFARISTQFGLRFDPFCILLPCLSHKIVCPPLSGAQQCRGLGLSSPDEGCGKR